MILLTDTDMLYLTEPQARSCAAVYLFLGRSPSKYARERLNGPYMLIATFQKNLPPPLQKLKLVVA